MALFHAYRFCVIYVLFTMLENSESSSLPEEPLHIHTGCYGTHDFQPACASTDTVMAVRGTWVGAKQIATGCPQIAETSNRQVVDAVNDTIVINVTECCSPNIETDCVFPKVQPEYTYQRNCSGLTNCSRPMPVFWNQTQNSSCPSTSVRPHLPNTNYMYMEYYCIPKTRISQMTNNVAESSTLPHYLQNSGYPSDVTSGSTVTTCSVTSDQCDISIYIYTIHLRLVSNRTVCQQELSVWVEDQPIVHWSCDSQTYFNITNQTLGYRHVTIKFINHATGDGGNFWIGYQASDGSKLQLSCPASDPPVASCTTKTSPSSQSEDSASSIGLIVGIVVGLLVTAILIALCLFWYCVIRKRKKTIQIDDNQNNVKQSNEELNKQNESAIPQLLGVKSNALPPINHSLSKSSHTRRNNSVSAKNSLLPEHPQPNRLPPIGTADAKVESFRKTKKEKKVKKGKKEQQRKRMESAVNEETNGVLLPNQTMPINAQTDTVGFALDSSIHSHTSDQSFV